jgi:CDGSH-type Zn-finger protein
MGYSIELFFYLEVTMSKKVIAQRRPIVGEYEAGTYWWCSCGHSQNQPFCDGSHKGTEFTPLKVDLTEKKRVAWCCCKYTKNQPFCDGIHSKLPDDV